MIFNERKKINILPETFDYIQQCATEEYPKEMCGFLKPDGSFIKVTNTHENPEKAFKIDATERVKHGDAIAIIHTHCSKNYQATDIRTPSLADAKSQIETGLPWLIYGCDKDNITTEPVQIPRYPNPDYVHRPFVTGFTDCYSIVQDYYWFELGICLKDPKIYSIQDIVRGLDSFSEDNIIEYGFVKVDINTIRNGDIILVNNGVGERNHLGIFHDGKILHQDSISNFEPFEHYIGRIHSVLRYQP